MSEESKPSELTPDFLSVSANLGNALGAALREHEDIEIRMLLFGVPQNPIMSKWYTVAEHLPDPGIPVLVWDNQEVVLAMREVGEYNEHWVLCDPRLHEEFGVTGHVVCWCPIPIIPEELK